MDKIISLDFLSGKPIYRQVADALRAAILSGVLKEGDRLPPEVELAASLSINTRTLRKGLAILAEQKLISQIQGRGTLVAFSKRTLTKIGLVGEGNSAPYSPYTLNLLTEIMLFCTSHADIQLILLSGNDPENISRRVQETSCDALIILSTQKNLHLKFCSPAFDALPMVLINSPVEEEAASAGRYQVRTTPGSMGTGVKKLYEMGHRRIAFICQEATSQCADLKSYYQDFLDTCRKLRLSTRYARLGKATQQWYDIGREIAIELFSCEKRPTALLTPGITFASGAWQGLNELGLKIPEDVSFVATNPIRAINPYMSGLCVPIRKLAEKAVSLVLDQFTPGKHLKQKIYEFPVEFVEAGSCRILPRK